MNLAMKKSLQSRLSIAMERITPQLAENWLNHFNTGNRKLREGVAERYSEDMKEGRWTECPEPISFFEDGELADGQHRLYAIYLSGVAVDFFVVRGLSREAGLNINTGLVRSLVDNARISGADTGLSNQLIGLARTIELGNVTSKTAMTNAQKLDLVEKHRSAAEWVIAHGPRGRGLSNAMVNTAIARAWYYEESEERLEHFGAVFSSGHPTHPEKDSAAISLRTYFLTRPGLNTTALWRDTFLKAMNAVHYFMEGKRLTVIKTVKDEAYPLPKSRTRKTK